MFNECVLIHRRLLRSCLAPLFPQYEYSVREQCGCRGGRVTALSGFSETSEFPQHPAEAECSFSLADSVSIFSEIAAEQIYDKKEPRETRTRGRTPCLGFTRSDGLSRPGVRLEADQFPTAAFCRAMSCASRLAALPRRADLRPPN